MISCSIALMYWIFISDRKMKGPPNDQDAAKEDDFSEFMWMAEENLEDFDKKVKNH